MFIITALNFTRVLKINLDHPNLPHSNKIYNKKIDEKAVRNSMTLH